MGVKSLWTVLRANNLVCQWKGDDLTSMPALAAELDGKVIAIDMSMWLMQAGEQAALAPHFSIVEGAAKVAFERTLQLLRFGVTPVFVLEGAAPAEKAAAQYRRLFRTAAPASYSNARGSGLSSSQSSAFTQLGRHVATVLQAMGLPVLEAPGEAEATCAALAMAGVVDGVASFDSDALLFGAETVYMNLKLSATNERNCEVTVARLSTIRQHLGLTAPGSGLQALALLAALSGCDYDESGAQGVGATGAMKDLRLSWQDLQNPTLAELTKCTGCAHCGHESGRKGKIKCHTAANPCACCDLPSGGCAARAGPCECAFHRRADERKVERIAVKARSERGLVQRVRESAAVYQREMNAAKAFVQQQVRSRKMGAGEKFQWQYRPSTLSVHAAFNNLPGVKGLNWDESIVRSKLLPALIEYDLRRGSGSRELEFQPRLIKKLHGTGGPDAQWRYLVEFTRTEADAEGLGSALLHELGNGRGASSQPAPIRTPNLGNGGGLDEAGPSQQQQQLPCFLPRAGSSDDDDIDPVGGADEAAKVVSVQEFDRQWLASSSARPHRAVRQSIFQRLWPAVEDAWLNKSNAGAAKKKKTTKAAAAAAAAVAATQEDPAQTLKRAVTKNKNEVMPSGSLDRYLVPKPRSRVAMEVLDEDEEEEDVMKIVAKPLPRRSRGLGSSSGGARLGRQQPGPVEEDREAGPSVVDLLGSPSKRQKTPTTAKTASRLASPPSTLPETENIKTLRKIIENRTARKAAEAAAGVPTQQQRQQMRRVRQRAGEVQRLLNSGGDRLNNTRNRVSEEVQVIDLTQMDEDQTETPPEQRRTQRRGGRRSSVRESPATQVIDLTGLDDD